MQWIEVSVPTRSDEIDDVCAQLAELGAGGMVVEDETDFQQFLEQNHQYWDYVDDALEAQFRGVSRIKFYLADDDDGRAQLAAIRAGIGRELTTATVRDSDWENNWRQYYQPIEVGERLVVVPEWLDAPADGRLPLRALRRRRQDGARPRLRQRHPRHRRTAARLCARHRLRH